jgi:hypothetical protein
LSKLPAIQFYTGDWLKAPDVRSVSYAARGLWFDMLCLMSESAPRGFLTVNGKPVSPDLLARMTGGSADEVSRLLTELDSAGVYSKDDRGIIFSRRILRDEKKRAQARRFGKKGGNPLLIAGWGVNPPLNPALKMKLKMQDGLFVGEGVEGGIPPKLQTEAFLNAWADWLLHRIEIEKPVTPTMAKQQLRDMEEWGEARAIAAIRYTTGKGWWGLAEPGKSHPRSPDANGQRSTDRVQGVLKARHHDRRTS